MLMNIVRMCHGCEMDHICPDVTQPTFTWFVLHYCRCMRASDVRVVMNRSSRRVQRLARRRRIRKTASADNAAAQTYWQTICDNMIACLHRQSLQLEWDWDEDLPIRGYECRLHQTRSSGGLSPLAGWLRLSM